MSRDPLRHPFVSTSIWNQPIGASAAYALPQPTAKQASLFPAQKKDMTCDVTTCCMDPTQPLRAVKGLPGSPVPLNKAMLVAAGSQNGGASFVYADGHRYTQGHGFLNNGTTASIAGTNNAPIPQDLKTGDGLVGAKGGSGMDMAGGVLRVNELVPGGVIAHALAINIDDGANAFASSGKSYVWPATKQDGYNYSPGGINKLLGAGTLFALLPTFDMTQLQTEAGKILAACFRDYGAYNVNDSARSVNAIVTEISGAANDPAHDLEANFAAAWKASSAEFANNTVAFVTPSSVVSGATAKWNKDLALIYKSLHIVTNNTLANYKLALANYATGDPTKFTGAGGGAPRVAYAAAC